MATPLLIVLAALALPLLSTGARFFLEAQLGWRCPFLVLFHLPCPSCGTTRALAALSEWRLLQAWQLNPLMMTLLASAPLLLAFRERLLKSPAWGWPVLFGAVFLNWIYLIWFLPR